MYLLDTNVLSELRKHDRADRNVWHWAEQADPFGLFISAVTVLELEQGVLLAERRDPVQGQRLRHWLEAQVLPSFEGRVLSFDAAAARRCAQLHVPDPRSYRDAMIAATADVAGLTVVTRNTQDFEATGVTLLNPWEAQA
jgi:predicted nucleic acid-binding protein